MCTAGKAKLLWLTPGLGVLASCALDPSYLRGSEQIAGLGPTSSSVIKSLKCEIITFLVENKLRAEIWANGFNELNGLDPTDPRFVSIAEKLRSIPYLDIDSEQYAALQGEFQNIDTFTAGLSFSWVYQVSPVLSKTYQAGPSYSQTRTFTTTQPIAIPQDADLGSSKTWVLPTDNHTPKAAKFTTLYNLHPREDEEFFCYKSFYNSTASRIDDALADVQRLVNGDPGTERFTRFTRIYVDGATFASWLQAQAAALSSNYRTFEASAESILPGQLEYAFILDVKPTIGGQYTLLHNVINPFTVSASGDLEHSTTFTLWLNTKYALPALNAQLGNSCVGVVSNSECTNEVSLPFSLPVAH